MGWKAGRCNKTSIPQGIFIMIPSLEGWPTKAKEAPSPHEVRLTGQSKRCFQASKCLDIH